MTHGVEVRLSWPGTIYTTKEILQQDHYKRTTTAWQIGRWSVEMVDTSTEGAPPGECLVNKCMTLKSDIGHPLMKCTPKMMAYQWKATASWNQMVISIPQMETISKTKIEQISMVEPTQKFWRISSLLDQMARRIWETHKWKILS